MLATVNSVYTCIHIQNTPFTLPGESETSIEIHVSVRSKLNKITYI